MRVNHPGIAQLSGARHGPVVVGSNPDGGMGLLDRAELEMGLHQTAVLGVEGHCVASPQALDHLQVLTQACDTLALAEAECFVFDGTVAEPSAQNKPPTREDVKRRCFFGNSDRVEEW